MYRYEELVDMNPILQGSTIVRFWSVKPGLSYFRLKGPVVEVHRATGSLVHSCISTGNLLNVTLVLWCQWICFFTVDEVELMYCATQTFLKVEVHGEIFGDCHMKSLLNAQGDVWT
jgi:hypothetical protein